MAVEWLMMWVGMSIFLSCYLVFQCLILSMVARPQVELGVELFFKEGHVELIKGKRVGLITNHTGVDSQLRSTVDLFKEHAKEYELVALFAPEHGIRGDVHAEMHIEDGKDVKGIPIYSLYGQTRRPTEKMLEGIDVLIYDIQDIGSRSYTYATTLYYAMEEAAKKGISLIVLDRPNPINGMTVDGPMLSEKWRSFIGYINIPYCHGMTIGELAHFFNGEYRVGCRLKVISMRGWKRSMSFKETGLSWIPTSPYIPEPDTPLFYASTGILGELNLVNLGGGYSLPFKIVGAPWVNAARFSEMLNAQKLPGVHFFPLYYRPYYGGHKDMDCEGVMIIVKDPILYRPVAVQYLLLGLLKTLYPQNMAKHLEELTKARKNLFCQANGTDEVLELLLKEKYVAWKLIDLHKVERTRFLTTREKYLIYRD
jgi:uncharacterized protein YbbC (DUF1343 family)